jgi:hypothetical protein
MHGIHRKLQTLNPVGIQEGFKHLTLIIQSSTMDVDGKR